MSYCKFEGTLTELRACEEGMFECSSKEEHKARKRLVKLCQEIGENYSDDYQINGEYKEEE